MANLLFPVTLISSFTTKMRTSAHHTPGDTPSDCPTNCRCSPAVKTVSCVGLWQRTRSIAYLQTQIWFSFSKHVLISSQIQHSVGSQNSGKITHFFAIRFLETSYLSHIFSDHRNFVPDQKSKDSGSFSEILCYKFLI